MCGVWGVRSGIVWKRTWFAPCSWVIFDNSSRAKIRAEIRTIRTHRTLRVLHPDVMQMARRKTLTLESACFSVRRKRVRPLHSPHALKPYGDKYSDESNRESAAFTLYFSHMARAYFSQRGPALRQSLATMRCGGPIWKWSKASLSEMEHGRPTLSMTSRSFCSHWDPRRYHHIGVEKDNDFVVSKLCTVALREEIVDGEGLVEG
eukprot:9487743-Pyramimonas_sp.AAC.1